VDVSFDNCSTQRSSYIPVGATPGEISTVKTNALLAAALICASPLSLGPAVAASKGEAVAKSQRAQKQVRQKGHHRVIRHRHPAPVATAQRNRFWPDPSFDRNGRPYKPNVHYPCMVDLGYGRFGTCDSFNE
jgi:hypothetical protein